MKDGHITKGKVTLNTTFLSQYGAFAADHVLCQELGHIWGLGHQLVLNSCMNNMATAETEEEWLRQLNAAGSDSPNAHDTEQLIAIYDAHSLTEAGGGGGGHGGGPNKCTGGPKKCSQGRWVTVHVFPVPNFD